MPAGIGVTLAYGLGLLALLALIIPLLIHLFNPRPGIIIEFPGVSGLRALQSSDKNRLSIKDKWLLFLRCLLLMLLALLLSEPLLTQQKAQKFNDEMPIYSLDSRSTNANHAVNKTSTDLKLPDHSHQLNSKNKTKKYDTEHEDSIGKVKREVFEQLPFPHLLNEVRLESWQKNHLSVANRQTQLITDGLVLNFANRHEIDSQSIVIDHINRAASPSKKRLHIYYSPDLEKFARQIPLLWQRKYGSSAIERIFTEVVLQPLAELEQNKQVKDSNRRPSFANTPALNLILSTGQISQINKNKKPKKSKAHTISILNVLPAILNEGPMTTNVTGGDDVFGSRNLRVSRQLNHIINSKNTDEKKSEQLLLLLLQATEINPQNNLPEQSAILANGNFIAQKKTTHSNNSANTEASGVESVIETELLEAELQQAPVMAVAGSESKIRYLLLFLLIIVWLAERTIASRKAA